MIPLLRLGLRLTRAGGWLRPVSIVVGNAVAVLLTMFALGLPAALFPDPVLRARHRVEVLAVAVFLIVPAAVLLVTVGRLSSGVRDRRLAALRAVGLSPGKARVIAGVENGSLAAIGALVGLGGFLALRHAVAAFEAGHFGPMPGSFDVQPALALLAALAVVATSVVVGTAATWTTGSTLADRSEAARRRPRLWRLAVLATGLALMVATARIDLTPQNNLTWAIAFLAGAVITVVGLAITVPLVTDLAATALARWRGSPTITLAARSTQADALGASRVVAGLAVAVFLATGAVGFLRMTESQPHWERAIQAFGSGPQDIHLRREQFTTELPPGLLDIPGVHGVVDDTRGWTLEVLEDGTAVPGNVVIGTCAELDLVLSLAHTTQTGCDESRPALMTWSEAPFWGSQILLDNGSAVIWPDVGEWPFVDSDTALHFGTSDVTIAQVTAAVPATHLVFDLSGPPIIQAGSPTISTAIAAQNAIVFVPQTLIPADIAAAAPIWPVVIADGGTEVQDAVSAWANAHGLEAGSPWGADWDSILRTRAAVYTLAGIALAVALLTFGLSAADRAIERRRSVARQVMAGVPARVLRRSQLIQVVFPAIIAAGMALAAGAISLRAVVNLWEGSDAAGLPASQWLILIALIATGVTLVTLATLPLTRTHVTAELLRRE